MCISVYCAGRDLMCRMKVGHFVAVLVIVVHYVHSSAICKESLGLDGCALLPPDDRCGRTRPSPRVIGGDDAKLGQFPWMALLYAVEDDVSRFVCGGAIISDIFIVTAAHCCDQPGNVKIVSVRVGEHDKGSEIDCEAGTCAPPHQDIEVDRYVIHEAYDSDITRMNMFPNDICLLHLRHPISFNAFVAPICIPTGNEFENKSFEGQYLEVAGWGYKRYVFLKDTSAQVLQTTSLVVVPNSECEIKLNHTIRTPSLCVGGKGNKDTCGGDSGGPLMGRLTDASDSSLKYYMLGVVSYGEKRCSGNLPAVYVNVHKYAKWILNTMVKLEKAV